MDSKFDSIFDTVSLRHNRGYETQPIMLDRRTLNALDDLGASVQAFCIMKNQATCNEIAKSLDKLYPNTRCKGVIYTNNTDNPFFGLVVMPVIDSSMVYQIINGSSLYRVTEYYIEIDSKMVDVLVGEESFYLTALIVRNTSELLYDCGLNDAPFLAGHSTQPQETPAPAEGKGKWGRSWLSRIGGAIGDVATGLWNGISNPSTMGSILGG